MPKNSNLSNNVKVMLKFNVDTRLLLLWLNGMFVWMSHVHRWSPDPQPVVWVMCCRMSWRERRGLCFPSRNRDTLSDWTEADICSLLEPSQEPWQPHTLEGRPPERPTQKYENSLSFYYRQKLLKLEIYSIFNKKMNDVWQRQQQNTQNTLPWRAVWVSGSAVCSPRVWLASPLRNDCQWQISHYPPLRYNTYMFSYIYLSEWGHFTHIYRFYCTVLFLYTVS